MQDLLIPLTGFSVSGNLVLYRVKNFPFMEREVSCSLPLNSSCIQVSSRDVFLTECLKFDFFFFPSTLIYFHVPILEKLFDMNLVKKLFPSIFLLLL